MSKHAKNSPPLQFLESARSIPIEIPLPVLAVLESVENAFFELCVASGHQALAQWIDDRTLGECGAARSREAFPSCSGIPRSPAPRPRPRSHRARARCDGREAGRVE